MFEQARNSALVKNIPPEQLQDLIHRLDSIGPRAAQRRIKLKFLEHKVRYNKQNYEYIYDYFL